MNKKCIFYFVLLCTSMLFSCSQDEIVETAETAASSNTDTSSELLTLQSGVIVEKRGSDYFMEGDIILSSEQLTALNETGTIFAEMPENPEPEKSLHPVTNLPLEWYSDDIQTRATGIYPTSYNLWAMVRFVYNSQLTTYQKLCIKNALLNIEAATNVRFYNATGQPTHDNVYDFDYPYLDFVPTGNQDVSSSYVGRIGGRQQVSLANFAFASSYDTHVIEHEIGHAIGMLHEQCRYDRDSYVTVNTSNLTSSGLSQFSKRTTNYFIVGSYDFNSIMGYSSYTTSTSVVNDINQPMYTKKDGSTITQGWQFSNQDRMWVNNLYIPYIARSDVYRELDDVVYKSDNTVMTAQERLQLQAELNNGNSTPPAGGRIPNNF